MTRRESFKRHWKTLLVVAVVVLAIVAQREPTFTIALALGAGLLAMAEWHQPNCRALLTRSRLSQRNASASSWQLVKAIGESETPARRYARVNLKLRAFRDLSGLPRRSVAQRSRAVESMA